MSNSGSGDYSDAPVSVGEVRSGKSLSCTDWSPREALVQMLRAIDRGAVAPSSLIIVYNDHTDGDGKTVHFSVASPSGVAAVGMLAYAQYLMMSA